jgi:hypothetical protein
MITAVSMATAGKQMIEASGIGIPAFRDGAPENVRIEDGPFIVITEGISITPVRGGDAAGADTAEEEMQFDLYQMWQDRSGVPPKIAEVPQRAVDLMTILHGGQLLTAPHHVYALRVTNQVRTRNKEANTVRNLFLVTAFRQLI